MFLAHRHPSAHRTLGALTAILTVWCLGCSAFDPLLCRLFGTGAAVMDCAGAEQPASTPANATTTYGDESAVVVAVAVTLAVAVAPTSSGHGSPNAMRCDCQSCHAPPAALIALKPEPAPPPAIALIEPGSLASVGREPLVPPPEHRL